MCIYSRLNHGEYNHVSLLFQQVATLGDIQNKPNQMFFFSFVLCYFLFCFFYFRKKEQIIGTQK